MLFLLYPKLLYLLYLYLSLYHLLVVKITAPPTTLNTYLCVLPVKPSTNLWDIISVICLTRCFITPPTVHFFISGAKIASKCYLSNNRLRLFLAHNNEEAHFLKVSLFLLIPKPKKIILCIFIFRIKFHCFLI